MESKRLWVVGKDCGINSWEIQGVFETKIAAISVCRDESYFIGPVDLNVLYPDKTTEWPGAYYPLFKKRKPERARYRKRRFDIDG